MANMLNKRTVVLEQVAYVKSNGLRTLSFSTILTSTTSTTEYIKIIKIYRFAKTEKST